MNGSGKTTFINLLCRLYDPIEGQILLNGIDIRKYRYDEYMRIFAVVFQDFRLFALPLGQNVAAGAHYGSERVMDCLSKAGFGDRLKTLPDGLDTPLYKELDKNGVEVSGGEAQKIAIARALYQDAPFIVLDEPTAMLDPNGRKEVIRTAHELNRKKGVTIILITHYMEEVVDADKVIVMDQGKVVMQGTPREVFSQVGKLKEYRLDVPQVTILADLLRQSGIDVPVGVLHRQELVDAILRVAQIGE